MFLNRQCLLRWPILICNVHLCPWRYLFFKARFVHYDSNTDTLGSCMSKSNNSKMIITGRVKTSLSITVLFCTQRSSYIVIEWVQVRNVPSDMFAQRRFKSVCTFVQWSESSLHAWRNFADLAIQNAPSEDSDQTERMRSLIWILTRRTCQIVRFLTLWLKSSQTPNCLWHLNTDS